MSPANAAHRPDLAHEVAELTEAIGLLVRRVRAAAAEHELSMTESAVLTRLTEEGPATTASLARAEGVRPQSMGATVTALEERGLLRRRPHPSDGRQFMIEITGAGTALRDRARAARRGWFTSAVAELGEAEQETLFAAGRLIRQLVQSHEA